MRGKKERQGYTTEDGNFYEYDDAKNLIVGKYVDIAYERTSGYWVDDNDNIFSISGSTYGALVDDGASESETSRSSFENEYNGMPVSFDDAGDISVFKCVDIDGGRAVGYKAEYNGEFDISRSTYDALVEKGASESEKSVLVFLDDDRGKAVPVDDARQIYIRKVYDVDSGRVGRCVAECDYGEFSISESTCRALAKAGAHYDED